MSTAKTDQPITVRLLCALFLGVFIGKILPSGTLTGTPYDYEERQSTRCTTTGNDSPTGASVRTSLTTASELVHPGVPDEASRTEEKNGNDGEKGKSPLFVFPLLKELRSGWSNLQLPPLLQRNASGTGALIVDIGLDGGVEFFAAIENGFEVVGFEANPHTFAALAERCTAISTEGTHKCEVIRDLSAVKDSLPLRRLPGTSYLIHAGAADQSGEMTLNVKGAVSTLVAVPEGRWQSTATVPLVRIDEVIQEDVWMLKVDTQGFEHRVLQGAEMLFKRHTVRQLIFEVDPFLMSKQQIDVRMTLEMVQHMYGMICFSDRNDNGPCDYMGDSADGFYDKFFTDARPHFRGRVFSQCFEDFLCINTEKLWTGPIVPLA